MYTVTFWRPNEAHQISRFFETVRAARTCKWLAKRSIVKLSTEQYRKAAKIFYDHSCGCMPSQKTLDHLAENLQYKQRTPEELAAPAMLQALKELLRVDHLEESKCIPTQ